MTPEQRLKKPYARRLIPDERGGFVATIQEFPDLIAEAETADEAISSLDQAALSWIEAAEEMGQDIPEPIELGDFSGKIALRMPRSLHKQAVELATIERTSLNQFLVTAVSHYVGRRQSINEMKDLLSSSIQSISGLNISIRNYSAPAFTATSEGISSIDNQLLSLKLQDLRFFDSAKPTFSIER